MDVTALTERLGRRVPGAGGGQSGEANEGI